MEQVEIIKCKINRAERIIIGIATDLTGVF